MDFAIHPCHPHPLYPMPTIESARAFYTAADSSTTDHILRVLALAERVGRVEGADLEIVQAAVLLHDASGATPGAEGERASHHEVSAAFAGEVLGPRAGRMTAAPRRAALRIRAHRFRGDAAPRTLEAKVLFDCDKLDVLGAIGAAAGWATPRWPASR